MGVGRVVAAAEAEAVLAVQPAQAGRGSLTGPPDVDLRSRLFRWHRCRSGVLDRGDLELQGHLVADQDAAGLERGVPGDAVVLAVDGDRALEPDPQVAERVLGRA